MPGNIYNGRYTEVYYDTEEGREDTYRLWKAMKNSTAGMDINEMISHIFLLLRHNCASEPSREHGI